MRITMEGGLDGIKCMRTQLTLSVAEEGDVTVSSPNMIQPAFNTPVQLRVPDSAVREVRRPTAREFELQADGDVSTITGASPPPPPLVMMDGKDVDADIIYRCIRREREVQMKWAAIQKKMRDTGADDSAVRYIKTALAANISRVMDLFRRWDVDKTGTISLQEFRRGMKELNFEMSLGDIKALFADLDDNGNGVIEFGELDRAIRGSGIPLDTAIGGERSTLKGRAQVRRLRKYESAEEFRRQRKGKIGLKVDLTEDEDNPNNNTVQMRIRRALAANLSKVMTLFKAWDTDGNGEIDRSEFWFALNLLGLATDREQSDTLFTEFDTDGSGAIDFVELNRQLRIGDLDGDSLSERDRILRDCKQRQILELPPLARGDLRKRKPPSTPPQGIAEEELKDFFLDLLEHQRELESTIGAEGDIGEADSSQTPGALMSIRSSSLPDALARSLGIPQRPVLPKQASLVQPMASGRSVSPQRTIVSTGGGLRMEIVPAASSGKSTGASTLSSASAGSGVRLGRKATYRTRTVVSIPVPDRLKTRGLKPSQDEAMYRALWSDAGLSNWQRGSEVLLRQLAAGRSDCSLTEEQGGLTLGGSAQHGLTDYIPAFLARTAAPVGHLLLTKSAPILANTLQCDGVADVARTKLAAAYAPVG